MAENGDPETPGTPETASPPAAKKPEKKVDALLKKCFKIILYLKV